MKNAVDRVLCVRLPEPDNREFLAPEMEAKAR